MRTVLFIFCNIVVGSVDLKAQQLKNTNDSLAYSLGIMVGKSLQQEGYVNLPMDIFYLGIQSSYENGAMLMTLPQCEEYVRIGSTQMKMKQYESNKIAGEQFLATNKTREGVISLNNGLQYEILKAGDGALPTATDEVLVHYHGTLPNGQIFDSSVDRGEPISFPLNRVIKGWTEILQLMPVGSKWRVYIPHELAYGERSAGPYIQPFSALIFEIELLGIN